MDQHSRESRSESCAPIDIRINQFGRSADCLGRAGAAGRISRQLRGFLSDLLHLIEMAITVEHHIAAGRERRPYALPHSSRQCPHGNIVTHEQTLETDKSANHLVDYCRGNRRRAKGSIRLNTTCAVIAIGRSARARKAAKSLVSRIGVQSPPLAIACGYQPQLARLGICFKTGTIPPSTSPDANAPASAATFAAVWPNARSPMIGSEPGWERPPRGHNRC